MSQVRIYCTEERLETENVFFITSSMSDDVPSTSFLFSPRSAFQYTHTFVDTPVEADLVLVPYPIFNDSPGTRVALRRVFEQYERFGKPLVVFVGGDFSHLVNAPGFYTLKGTQYRRFLKDNEVIIPPFCEDLGETFGVQIRPKKEKPVVSFCGWAGFDTRVRYLKYLARLALVEVDKLIHLDGSREVFKKGVYFRRKALRALRGSTLVETNFIIRRSFSGHAKTIELSPEQARKEYVDNMINSDFVLAPKGDANYSVRFFEALSLGRIPILIDTECCLPLEDVIDYSKCILRVSYRDIKRLPEIVAEFYEKLTEEEYAAMQREARRVYAEYLRYDSFFGRVLSNISIKGE